jgi:hypothetical protein
VQNERSIEAQRARLLGKRSDPKPRSDKFVKKEIINMKYGLKKQTVSPKTNMKTFYISSGVFGVALLGTVFVLQPLLSFIISLVSFFVSLGILNSYQPKKVYIAPTIEYSINYVFEKYDAILSGEIKEKMIVIKGYVDELSTYELPLAYKHYVQSTTSRDIPDIFNHFSHLNKNDESKAKLLEQLSIIEAKLLDIQMTVQPDYEQKLEVKARVIKEKASR